jgi:hypothetical protein
VLRECSFLKMTKRQAEVALLRIEWFEKEGRVAPPMILSG